MSEDVRLDLLAGAISDSGLDGQIKDELADDLRYAQEINGSDDAALQGIKRLLISDIRRELKAYDRTKKAIAEHAERCKENQKYSMELAAESQTGFAKWVVLLMPAMWPIALMCFSPFAGDVLAKVIAALK